MSMLPTPSTSHVNYDQVYEPAEDSFLFLDTLSSSTETAFLRQRLGHGVDDDAVAAGAPFVFEVGTGSGVVLAFIAANARELFGQTDLLIAGSDVNLRACEATSRTIYKACTTNVSGLSGFPGSSTFIGMLNGDLASAVRSGTVDLLIFNPPYVPSASVPGVEEIDLMRLPRSSSDEASHLLSLSYEGGKEGMEVTKRLLEDLPRVLRRRRGVAYVLLCQQNHPEKVIANIAAWGHGWTACRVGRSGKHAGWEKLVILRIYQDLL